MEQNISLHKSQSSAIWQRNVRPMKQRIKKDTVSSKALKISALTRAWICPREPLAARVSLRAAFSSSRLAMDIKNFLVTETTHKFLFRMWDPEDLSPFPSTLVLGGFFGQSVCRVRYHCRPWTDPWTRTQHYWIVELDSAKISFQSLFVIHWVSCWVICFGKISQWCMHTWFGNSFIAFPAMRLESNAMISQECYILGPNPPQWAVHHGLKVIMAKANHWVTSDGRLQMLLAKMRIIWTVRKSLLQFFSHLNQESVAIRADWCLQWNGYWVLSRKVERQWVKAELRRGCTNWERMLEALFL
jgi:hypothetical protein